MSTKKETKVMSAFNYIVPLCLLLFAGCSQEDLDRDSASKEIQLGIDGIATDATNTRAAIDQWSNTTVSVAYAYGEYTLFDKALTVTVANDQGKHVKTGMEYPPDDTPVSFVGYHPAKDPNELGIVGYNLSAGNQDIMLSNALSGTESYPILASDPLKFQHQLTRFTFLMKCQSGSNYPETVHGVRASNASNKLMTYLHINLNSRQLNYSFPGQVTSSISEGAVVPEFNASADALKFDLMLQPKIPITFEVITLTDIKQITIVDSNALWQQLLDYGGEAGKQYTIWLWFSGVEILADGIAITSWIDVPNTYWATETWW